MAVHKNNSVIPKGDIVSVCLTNDALSNLIALLEKYNLLDHQDVNITTSRPLRISVAASMVGALVILTNKSVLTAGVMIALALIPAGTIVSIGIIILDSTITVRAFLRLLIEIGIVSLSSGLVIYWKKITVHKKLERQKSEA